MGALFQSWSRPWLIGFGLLLLLLLSLGIQKTRFAVLIVALLLGSTLMSMRQSAVESSVLHAHLGQSMVVRAVLSTDPHKLAPKVIRNSFAPPSYSALVRVVEIEVAGSKYSMRIPARLIATDIDFVNLLPGQMISAEVSALESREGRVAALLISRGEITVLTEPSRWGRFLDSIRDGLRGVSGSGDSGSLIPGMVLGDTSLQSATFNNDMRRSGLTHLVAVSGANFAIVSGFVLYLMQFLFRRMPLRLGATAIFLISFIALVRPSPSVLRAAAMASVLLLAKGTHRGRDALPALGFAIAAVVAADPWQARDAGFALSVLATAGLLLFAPKVIARFKGRVSEKVAQAIAPPIAATLFCAPVIVAISGQLSFMSIVANVLAAPAVAPITVVAFIAALISPIFPPLALLLVTVVKPLAAWIAWVASIAAHFSVITFAKGASSFFFIALLIAIGFFVNRRIFVAALVLILLVSWFMRFPGGDWQIANCDVGQGDSMVLNLGDHRGILIDTGPDPITQDRCLRQLGIKQIDLLILTHIHADHIGGLAGAKRNRKVLTQWFGDVRAGTRATVLSNRGPVTIEVLWPTAQWADEQESDPNNSSIAIIVRAPDYSLFAGGDMEPLTQAQIVPALSRVDIYKVCHHGSRFQDESFTRALSPTLSVISVGADNSYGHPAPETIDALTRLGSLVFRTDLDGAIAIKARQHRFTVTKSKGGFALLHWG